MARMLFLMVIGTVLALAGYGVGRTYFKLTDGFGPQELAGQFEYDNAWDIGPTSDEVRKLLSQKYTYMAKGTQSYVLRSQDDKYVVKFFKKKHLNFPEWQETLSRLPVIGRIFSETKQRRNEKRKTTFAGCKLAYDYMPEDSGIVYIHLNTSNDLPQELTIVDKMGWEHQINPNECSFYIQKKGVALYPELQRFKASGDVIGASKALNDLFSYLIQRSERGIFDRDSNYINNLGFIEGNAATLDIGCITTDQLIRNPREYSRRIVEHTQAIRQWIEANFAELLPEFEKSINTFKEHASS